MTRPTHDDKPTKYDPTCPHENTRIEEPTGTEICIDCRTLVLRNPHDDKPDTQSDKTELTNEEVVDYLIRNVADFQGLGVLGSKRKAMLKKNAIAALTARENRMVQEAVTEARIDELDNLPRYNNAKFGISNKIQVSKEWLRNRKAELTKDNPKDVI